MVVHTDRSAITESDERAIHIAFRERRNHSLHCWHYFPCPALFFPFRCFIFASVWALPIGHPSFLYFFLLIPLSHIIFHSLHKLSGFPFCPYFCPIPYLIYSSSFFPHYWQSMLSFLPSLPQDPFFHSSYSPILHSYCFSIVRYHFGLV